ncbi:MAG TPA: Spy/CpxP family protein refolding chaperone [Terriglobales bacterium]
MKFVGSKILAICMAVALLGSVALAQGPHGAGREGGGLFGGPMFDMMSDYLNLSDAQQTQIKQIMHSVKPAMEPLFQQEMQNHKAMMQLIMSNSFDEAKAQTLAQQSASIHEQIELAHAKAAQQAYQLLTPDQKTKLSEFLAKQEQRMQEHMQERGEHQAPPDSQ